MWPVPPRMGIPGSLETIVKIAANVEVKAICLVVSFFIKHHEFLDNYIDIELLGFKFFCKLELQTNWKKSILVQVSQFSHRTWSCSSQKMDGLSDAKRL